VHRTSQGAVTKTPAPTDTLGGRGATKPEDTSARRTCFRWGAGLAALGQGTRPFGPKMLNAAAAARCDPPKIFSRVGFERRALPLVPGVCRFTNGRKIGGGKFGP